MIRQDPPALPEGAGGRGVILRGAMPLLPIGQAARRPAAGGPRQARAPRSAGGRGAARRRGRRRHRSRRPLSRGHRRSDHVRHRRARLVRAARQRQRHRRARRPSALVPGHAAAARPAPPTRRRCARSSPSSPRRARSSRSRWSAATRRSRTGIDRPIVAGTMLGEVAKDRLVTTGGAQVGDAIVLTKGVPLEGAAIIAREKEAELRARGVPAAMIRRAKAFLRTPGDQRAARGRDRLRAGHACTPCTIRPRAASPPRCTSWPTAAGVGLRIDRDRITVLPEGRALCEAFGLDPLGTHRLRRAADDAGAGRGRHRHPRARPRGDRLSLHRPGRAARAGRHARGGHPPVAAAHVRRGTRSPSSSRRPDRCPSSDTRVARSPSGGTGLVASCHPLATLAGVETLKAGGTVADAAVATNAVLAVTQSEQLRARRRSLLPLLRGGHPPRALPQRRRPLGLARDARRAARGAG